MPNDDFEELKNAHEFYQEILEHNPADINKDFKEKYELKSKLFEYHKENRKSTAIARWITYIALLLLILLIIRIFLDTL
jgi:hypothetical protein